jgi:arylsulfatase A-like enzyme/Flp pilus assembly protein TadD
MGWKIWLGFLAASLAYPQGRAPAARPNVLLITIDTLRADYLGAYGNRKVQTPVMDGLASQGTLFERAYCQAPMTPPSHASILTGMYPQAHGVRDFTSPGLRAGFPTLAGLLKQSGYTTAAFVSAYVLDSVWGLNQGFDFYQDRFRPDDFRGVNPGNVQRKAGETIGLVLDWLGKNPRAPWFLWVHLFDPHHDYNAPEPFRTRYSGDRYGGEVAYTDHELGKLVAALKARDEFDSSLVILTSDHGESLGEHQESEHGFFIYDTTVRVPLIVKLPGTRRGPARVDALAETVDIAPTVLQVTGVPGDRRMPMQGSGLLSLLLEKQQGAQAFSYSETLYPLQNFGWSDLASYTEGKYKYIQAPKPELYDLSADAGETKNLIQAEQAVAGLMRRKLNSFRQRAGGQKGNDPVAADPRRVEALRALGYVAVTVPVKPGGRSGLADPKDRIHVFNRTLLAMQAADAGASARSNALLEEVVRMEPDLFIAHYLLGVNRLKAGESEESLKHFERANALNPGFDLTEINRASALSRLGRVDEAIGVLEALLRQSPPRLEARKQLALLFSRKKEHSKAIEIYQQILSTRPSDAELTKFLGIAQVEAQQYDPGSATLKKALSLGLDDAMVHNFLGIAEGNLGRPAEALAHYRKSLQIKPDYQQARLNLAFALRKAGQTAEAGKEFDIICTSGSPLCKQYQKYF